MRTHLTAYAVIRVDTDGRPEEDSVELFGDLDKAVTYLDAEKDDALRVFRAEPLPEAWLWDWANRKVGDAGRPMVYVNKGAARRCLPPGYELLKRRRGTDAWIPADNTDQTEGD